MSRASSSLHDAARDGDVQALDTALAAGADAHAKKYNGWTLLHEASLRGHLDCVDRLLAAGADANHARCGYTPLHWASLNGHTDCVDRLLAAGADANLANRCGGTPLHWASEFGYPDCVDRLLAAGADANHANNDGYTPLHWASENCVDRLLAAGANPLVREWCANETPAEVARLFRYKDLANRLVQAETEYRARRAALPLVVVSLGGDTYEVEGWAADPEQGCALQQPLLTAHGERLGAEAWEFTLVMGDDDTPADTLTPAAVNRLLDGTEDLDRVFLSYLEPDGAELRRKAPYDQQAT